MVGFDDDGIDGVDGISSDALNSDIAGAFQAALSANADYASMYSGFMQKYSPMPGMGGDANPYISGSPGAVDVNRLGHNQAMMVSTAGHPAGSTSSFMTNAVNTGGPMAESMRVLQELAQDQDAFNMLSSKRNEVMMFGSLFNNIVRGLGKLFTGQ